MQVFVASYRKSVKAEQNVTPHSWVAHRQLKCFVNILRLFNNRNLSVVWTEYSQWKIIFEIQYKNY